MRLLFGCLITVFLVGICNSSFAQSGFDVAGKVTTDNQTSAEGATITLLNLPDSSIVKSTICTQDGHFSFSHINAGNYIILAHKIGFKRVYSGKYSLTGNLYIADITLPMKNSDLKEVVITDKRDYIEVKPNKTVLNIDRSILATGNSVYDILSTAPGVRVLDNQILLKGGQKALVTINGKAVGQLNDDQLAELLKSYQSSSISQIELIENPSAKYDAAGGGGVINIILKKSKDIGFKAVLTENAAAGQDYKASTGINLNYRDEKFNIFANYNFSDSKTPRTLDINRTIGATDLDENYLGITYLKNSNFNFGVDYDIAPKQTIGGLINGFHNQAGVDKSDITYISNYGVPDSNITTQSHINRSVTNINYNLNYAGSFGKADKTTLSADFDYSNYTRGSSELLQNDFFLADGTPYQQPILYSDNSPSHIIVRSEKIDFSQILSKSGSLGIGVKNSQVKSNNNIDFESEPDVTGAVFTPVASLSDHFIYNERINAGYINYNDKFNKTSLALGLRGEQTSSESNSINPDTSIGRKYFDLFPSVEIIQEIDKVNQLVINYNRRILRPNYQDLNPFVAYIDQYSYSTGNVFLKPEYINTYSVSDLLKDKYKLTLSMVQTSDFFVPVFLQNDSTKVFTSTTDNLGTRYAYSAEVDVPVKIARWWDININVVGSYERFVYNLDSTRKSTYDIELVLTQNITIAKGLRAEIYSSLESPTYYGIKQYNAEFISSAGISKSVLNNTGSIKLAISDIFNSDRYRYTSHYENLDLTGEEKAGSRFLTATFIYRFGKQTVKGAAKRVSGAADEQKRLNGGSNDN
jgi:iron complex outermembrane receptor protein